MAPLSRSPDGTNRGLHRLIARTNENGEHHAAILGSRMGIHNNIVSDAAPLTEMVGSLIEHGIQIHAMRDVTRGGLGTVLNEFAAASHCCMNLQE